MTRRTLERGESVSSVPATNTRRRFGRLFPRSQKPGNGGTRHSRTRYGQRAQIQKLTLRWGYQVSLTVVVVTVCWPGM
jgi:hypothetical protein